MGPPPPLPSKTSIVSSSPGRAEKLPTPGFARLLRGKSSSRSRNQTPLSRSSPLFPSRNPSLSRSAPSIDTNPDGEPSSPKVTCIGQVRIRKKNKVSIRSDSKRNQTTQSDRKKRGERDPRCCFVNVFRSRGRQSIWRRWSARLRFKGNAVPLPLNDLGGIVFRKSEAEEYDESETRVFVPPKNALILMRCRSAPHNRSSALAAGFSAGCGNVEDEAVKGTDRNESCEEAEEEEEEEEEEESRCPSSRPLFLKRCNSEPAKKAARLLAPEAARCSQNGADDGGSSIKV